MTPEDLQDYIDTLVSAANKKDGLTNLYAKKMEKLARKSIIAAVMQNLDKDGKISNMDEVYIRNLVRNAYKSVFIPTAAQQLTLGLKIGFETIAKNTADTIGVLNGTEILTSRLNAYQVEFIANLESRILATFNNIDSRLQRNISDVIIQAAQTSKTRNQILQDINATQKSTRNAIELVSKLEVHEAYYGYQRATAEAVAAAYDMNYWAYIGTLKPGVQKKGKGGKMKTVGGSRPFCVHLINSMKGVFSDEDKPSLIRLFTGTTGYKKDTTTENFVVNCGGWFCRHIALPITKKKAQQLNPNL